MAGIEFSATALAGHTIAGGDCWKAGTPLWCRVSWSTSFPVARITLYNQFSHVRPSWLSQAETACNNWHNYTPSADPAADIQCQWQALPMDSAVYLKTASSGPLGVTWNCPSSGPCSNQAIAMDVLYSEIYFNISAMDSQGTTGRTWAFAHEMGHALGLHHHSGVLMNPTVNSYKGPTATDYGVKPPCSGAAGTGGVRCVFKITR